MSEVFLTSYALLWLLVLMQSVMLFVLLRELGRLYLGTSESLHRDGPTIGKLLPSLSVQTRHGRSDLRILLKSSYSLLLVATPGCNVCGPAAEVVHRWTLRGEGMTSMVILQSDDFPDEDAFGGVDVVLIAPDDATKALEVRATPFLMIVDDSGTLLAKGLVNTEHHVKLLVQRAQRQRRNAGANGNEMRSPSVVSRLLAR